MSRIPRDWSEFAGLFNAKNVEYLVVGAHALAFHGVPRLTGDLDLWIRPVRDNAVRVQEALGEFSFSSLRLTAADFDHPGPIVQLGFPPLRIDLLTELSGLSFEEAWADRVPGLLGEVQVHYVSRASLLKNKRATGRAKDLGDLESLGETIG